MIFRLLREAFDSLWRHRTRATLTLLGIAWGVAYFIILLAYGDGFGRALTLSMSYFGDNVTIIFNGQTSKQVGGQRAGRRIRLELQDVEDVRKNAPLIKRVSPEIFHRFPLQSRRRLTMNGVRGVNHEYGPMRGQFIAEGRLLSPEDIQEARRVAVLGNELRKKLFSESPALGQEIRINGLPFTVIGTMKKSVSHSNYSGVDGEQAFIPYTAMAALTPHSLSERDGGSAAEHGRGGSRPSSGQTDPGAPSPL